MNKKIFALVLIFALIFSLVACNQQPTSEEQDQESQTIKDNGNVLEGEQGQVGDNQEELGKEDAVDDKGQDTPTENKPSEGSEEGLVTKEDPVDESEESKEVLQQNLNIKLSIEGPSDIGFIYQNDKYQLNDDEMTALDILKALQKDKIIRFEHTGSGNTAYLQGIEDYYEFDYGPLSGWMIQLNGEFPLKSIGALKIAPGDIVRFRYSEELGNDLTD